MGAVKRGILRERYWEARRYKKDVTIMIVLYHKSPIRRHTTLLLFNYTVLCLSLFSIQHTVSFNMFSRSILSLSLSHTHRLPIVYSVGIREGMYSSYVHILYNQMLDDCPPIV